MKRSRDPQAIAQAGHKMMEAIKTFTHNHADHWAFSDKYAVLRRLPAWIKARIRTLEKSGEVPWHWERKWANWEEDQLQQLLNIGNLVALSDPFDHINYIRDKHGNELLIFEPYGLSLEAIPAIQRLAALLDADVRFSGFSLHYPLATICIIFQPKDMVYGDPAGEPAASEPTSAQGMDHV